MFHPVHTFIAKFVTNFEARELHQTILEDGELVYELPTLQEIRQFAAGNLEVLWEEYKRLLNPAEYPVNLSQDCWNNKMRLIEDAQHRVQQRMANPDG
ncbi:nicotinate phosphoribosyltransferase [compost metagenome]